VENQCLAARKRESFVNLLSLRLCVLIKKYTQTTTTQSCARRSPEPPGFLLPVFLPGTAGILPAFLSTIWC
jgi:hypothetical protein